MTEETESCTLESAVRGHHVYKTTWSPAIGQVLQVRAEDSNAYDIAANLDSLLVGVVCIGLPFLLSPRRLLI